MQHTPTAPLNDSPAKPSREFTLMMAAMMAAVALSIDALLPALGVIAQELQVQNRNHTQFLIGGLFMGMALGQLIAGPLSDALGRRRVLFTGLAIHFAGSLVCLFAPSFGVLLAGRIIQGLGAAGPYVSAVSIVRDKYSGRAMARVMSLVMMIFIMVPAVAPSLGQAVMELAGWRDIFVMYLGYAMVLCAWVALRLKETLPRERRIPFNPRNILHGLRAVLRTRVSMCYTLCMGICFGSLLGYLNSSQQIFQDHFNTGKRFTLYFGALAMVIGLSSLVNARIVQRLGMRYIALRAMAATVASSALFLLLHLFVEPTLPMFMAYAATLFFCFGLIQGNLNALAMEPMGNMAGLAASVIGASSSVFSMSIGAVVGQSYNDTLIPMATAFTVLFSVGLLIMRYAGQQPFPQQTA
ncbi:MAG: Bcr/CflA family drug resistance efflux transporter [Azospirillum brasilense]|nr:MAG: Bcr/CflA family drug resistance efflux transporter [Azospirillum brasilense]